MLRTSSLALCNPNVLRYVLSGVTVPSGALWRCSVVRAIGTFDRIPPLRGVIMFSLLRIISGGPSATELSGLAGMCRL
jgi:hypothetical protein